MRIGSTHGWRAATGKELLLDVTTADAVCKTYVELCAAREGAAAAEKVKEKRNKCKHTLRPEQYLQTLAFESEGYTSPEAQQLLLVWAQMWAEKRNESPAAAKRLYYAWSCELAHLERSTRQVLGALHHGARAAIIRGGGQQGQDAC